MFSIIPNLILNLSYPVFSEAYGISVAELGIVMASRSVAGFGGFWLAWFLVRMKNPFSSLSVFRFDNIRPASLSGTFL